jgi:selenocysteine lyase/cysteine desulfurase
VIYAMGASLEMMLEIGPERIERRVMELAAATRDLLRRLGGRLPFDESPHYESPVISARFEGQDASALAKKLKERRVLASARHGFFRASTHFYNNQQDLERLERELAELLGV